MKTKNIVYASVAIALTACATQPRTDRFATAFAQADSLAASIAAPTFPDVRMSIDAFGASTQADAATNKAAICAAIDSVSALGGGTVAVPAGSWLTGPLTLKSHVNLCIEEGATLMFSTDHQDYLPAVLTRWEGVDCYNLHPLIYAYGQTDIAITGSGTIDGCGNEESWWFMKGRPQYGWREGLLSQELGGRARLLEFDQNQVPVEQRIMTIEDALRPQLINIYNCSNVLIENVTLRNSPFWVIHPLMVENMIVRGVRIDSHGPNSDGCDPESSRNVLIENCFFNTGDDCIAIKSGRNFDGRRWNRPAENIMVRKCEMKNGHGGVVIGSEIAGGFRNLWVENCTMDSPELDRVIRIKTNDCRGGVIENIFVRNVEVGQCREAVVKINLKYEPDEVCTRGFVPYVCNVNLQNVNSRKSRHGIFVVGLDESDEYVDGLTIENCRFDGVEDGNRVSQMRNLHFDNLLINGQPAQE